MAASSFSTRSVSSFILLCRFLEFAWFLSRYSLRVSNDSPPSVPTTRAFQQSAMISAPGRDRFGSRSIACWTDVCMTPGVRRGISLSLSLHVQTEINPFAQFEASDHLRAGNAEPTMSLGWCNGHHGFLRRSIHCFHSYICNGRHHPPPPTSYQRLRCTRPVRSQHSARCTEHAPPFRHAPITLVMLEPIHGPVHGKGKGPALTFSSGDA